jgi:formylglycine-generating enzyme required for sulfatase activity
MKKSAASDPRVPAPGLRRWWNGLALAALVCLGLGLLVLARPTGSKEPPEGMVWIPPGEFTLGNEDFPDAVPVHRVWVDGFWMDRTEVTNAQWAKFAATGYLTVAERTPKPEDFSPSMRQNLKPEMLVPLSLVFTPPAVCPPEGCGTCDAWWKAVPGACWKHPQGPESDVLGKEKHPVVHIAWEDAVAYAKWAGKRLPTEAEWERAARGGVADQPFYWGSELTPNGQWMANIWQGKFPCENTAEDGHAGTAPVASYPANPFGLHDMAGNVWEWCSDWYQPRYEVEPGDVSRNPRGPASSIDPHGTDEPKRVQRGGSFLCSDAFCARYRAGARGQGEPMTGQSHTGFRCVKDR